MPLKTNQQALVDQIKTKKIIYFQKMVEPPKLKKKSF